MQGLTEAPSTSDKMAHNELSSDSGDKVDGVTGIKLPAQLQKINPATEFVSVRHRWNTNEELASILIAFDRHKEWLLPQKIRPASGSMLLYNRKVVFYRRDGYCWKKRRNGSTIREDHMKLKVQGLECIYGSYVHSAILPTFHRRCYWLLQNPNIVLIHYLNVPYPEAAKPSICELSSNQWSKEQLVDQLRPMLSKVSEGMERNIDEDKRVEKMLEEILQILMPLQDGRMAKPLLNKEKMLAVKQFGSSSSNTTQQQVIQPSHRVIMTGPQQPIQLKPVQPGVVTSTSTSTCIGGTSNGISRISQVFGMVPSVTSNSTSSNMAGTSNGIGQIGQVLGVLPSGLLTCDQSSISNGSATQLVTLGNPNQLVIAERNTPAMTTSTECTMETAEERDEDMKEIKNLLEENSSVKFQKGVASYNDHGCGVLGPLKFASQPNGISLNQPVLTRVAHLSSGSAHVTESRSHTQQNAHSNFHVNLNQESLSSSQAPKYSQPPQPSQQQQVVINSIAQNQSVQNNPGPSPPVLTLHLKSGFVLSLEGATVVSQHSSMPVILSGSGGTANSSPSSNSSCGNTSLVLVASQNSSGAEVSFRQPVCFSQGTNMAAPGAPNDSSVTQQFPVQGCHPHSAFSVPGSRIDFDQFNNSSNNICSTQNSTASFNQNSQTWSLIANSSQHQNAIINNRLPSLTEVTPTSQHFSMTKDNKNQDAGYGVRGTSSHLYPSSHLGSTASCSNMSGLQTNSLTHQGISPLPNPFIYSSPTTQVADHSNLHHQRHITPFQQRQQQRFETISPPTPPITASSSSSKDSANPFLASVSDGNLFKFDSHSASQFSPISSVKVSENKPQYPNSHHNSSDEVLASLSTDQESNGNPQVMMAGPSGLNSMDKEMITNSNSCDTLDGSFSSLPSADLNLDDLLDLNDLDDVSDLGSSPFTPPNISLQILDKSCMDHQPIVSTHNEGFSNPIPQESSTSCMSSSSQLQQLQHHHFHLHLAVPEHEQKQTHIVQQAPTSPLHPGAPPRPHNSLARQPMTSTSSVFSCDNTHPVSSVGPKTSSVIKDFSPDWAYINTNTKVLVAGPWQSENSFYTCVFDGEHIPAILIQAGLLRCYAQHHTPGYATLQVARDGIIISNCEVFTFCDRGKSNNCSDNHPEWFAFDVNQLKLLLVERLNQLCRLFIDIQPLNQGTLCSADLVTLEQKLIEQIEVLSGKEVCDTQTLPKAGQHNLTLLHLAAGLGLTKLVACLIRCRMVNKCMALEFDVDAQSVDSHSCTPMTWACAHGHTAAVLTLYHWNSAPLKMCNRDGLLPLALARQRGHHNLASQVEQLEQAKEGENRQHGTINTMDVSCCHVLTPGTEAPSSISSNCSSTGFLDPAIKDENHINEKDGSKMNEDEEAEQCAETRTRERQMQPPDVGLFSRPCKPGPKLIRRFSEQVLVPQSRPLSKRNSVDLLPSGQSLDQPSHPGIASPAPLAPQSLSPSASPSSPSLAGSLLTPGSCGEASMRSAQDGELGSAVQQLSEGDRVCSPDLTDVAFVVPPAPRLTLEEKLDEPSGYRGHDEDEEEEAVEETIEGGSTSRMDTDDIITHSTDSPLIDVERISSDDERDVEPSKDGSKHQMVTLANQIIAAIPERIKLSPAKDELDEASVSGRGRAESHGSIPSQGGSPRPSSFGDDSGISTPMTDSLAFDEYRYPELGTPSSSLSPESTCLPSPYSPYSFTLDSPPPTTAEFTEYFNAPTTYMEKDFSQLTLSDQEQRKLYEAAKVIQNAYRHYRDKQQQKEIEAAILIQSYYRRYKTYAYYKKMSQAAVLIQNQFRTYYARRKKRGDLSSVNRRESERLKKGRNQSVIIQQRFRSHYQRRSFEGKDGAGPSTGNGDGPESSPPPVGDPSSPCREETHPIDAKKTEEKRDSDLGQELSRDGSDLNRKVSPAREAKTCNKHNAETGADVDARSGEGSCSSSCGQRRNSEVKNVVKNPSGMETVEGDVFNASTSSGCDQGKVSAESFVPLAGGVVKSYKDKTCDKDEDFGCSSNAHACCKEAEDDYVEQD